jgi:hypothetical protein
MNAYAVFVVNEHLDMLRREAAERRAANEGRPGIGARIAARLSEIRTAFARSETDNSPAITTLRTDPYQG